MGNTKEFINGSALSHEGHVHSQYSLTSHNHDDRYYTEAEVNNLLANKIDKSTGVSVYNLINIINSISNASNYISYGSMPLSYRTVDISQTLISTNCDYKFAAAGNYITYSFDLSNLPTNAYVLAILVDIRGSGNFIDITMSMESNVNGNIHTSDNVLINTNNAYKSLVLNDLSDSLITRTSMLTITWTVKTIVPNCYWYFGNDKTTAQAAYILLD